MMMATDPPAPRVICDAMFGGVARWLRLWGVDTAYTAGIADAALVAQARAEQRIVVSSDGPLFERRVFTSGQLPGVRVPVGLKLNAQVQYVVAALAVEPGVPRCTRCNGLLAEVPRQEVADVVPARSLIWSPAFFRCTACGHVFWEGTHWERIRRRLPRPGPFKWSP